MKYPFEKNTIYVGDCKDVLEEFPVGGADLIYLDPPFFSNKDYEIVFDDGAEKRGFEDRWKGGIEQYKNWMRKRIEPMYDVLKDTGSLYLHCDWHADSYLRTLLDDIFDRDNFQNEIIWKYGLGGGSDRYYRRKHDTIFFYTKTDEWNFNAPKVPATSQKMKGKEKVMPDVWTDIPSLNNMSNERMGYPTQKPKELLERIIKASSNEGDLVLDPFCGCGTAIDAAEELNRNWIGIDISATGAEVMKKRMWNEHNINSDVIGLPQKKKQKIQWIKDQPPIPFQNYMVRCYNGRQQKKKRSDKGIDGWTENEKPIQVKKSEKVGRPVLDKFESAIKRDNKDKGIIVALSFSKGANEEAARVKNNGELEIELVKLDDLIEEKMAEEKLPAVIRPLKNLINGDGGQEILNGEN